MMVRDWLERCLMSFLVFFGYFLMSAYIGKAPQSNRFFGQVAKMGVTFQADE